ncbi:MAG: O-linked N-acetylglucosamine transferase, SPINDLY family protein [Allorhizobium sp.]|uniref:O-linked N-acetylglucosamine transferase, SPINDLY family protein n=1 Tax=Allorhizobium sp. TaxID=633478 RepID=UPI00403491B1
MVIHTAFAPEQNAQLAAAMDKARSQKLSLIELLQLAEHWGASGQSALAAELYKTWTAFNDQSPLLHLAFFNYSVVLKALGDTAGAINALKAALRAAPMMGQAHINLGRTYEDCGLGALAIQQWRSYVEQTSEITPDKSVHRLMALQHIGRVMEGASFYADAETALWQAIELRPDKPEAGQHWISVRQHQCKWPVVQASEYVTKKQMLDSISPLPLACYSDDPLYQMAKAARYFKMLAGRPDPAHLNRPEPRKKVGTGQRLRIGYVSSDLRDHAVGFALSEVLELHDKSSVEVYAYYIGDARTNDATQNRMKAVIDVWRDVTAMSDLEAAKLIMADEIDVLIDVNGYTKLARTKIFSYRPAPVIVNFCGYPGTMASPVHQYIIADEQIIPPGNELYYTEKVLHIPCNQPVDRKRLIGPRPTRTEAGLPEDAFVFACFNGMQKITAGVFTRWMAILTATPGSVLWLLGGSDVVNQRLRELATSAGVDPARIYFAPKAANPNHLARIAIADLFLDTFPYGAHSTASDALTMGLPVLTVPGKSFASRFCSSIVKSAGVPELICATPDEYVRKAVALARDPAALAHIRNSIQAQRETCALRDIPRLVRRLEELYWQMQGERERGETPVPDLSNMEMYYEIGTDVVLAEVEFEDEATYRKRYQDRIADWHAFHPVPHDTRLWPAKPA